MLAGICLGTLPAAPHPWRASQHRSSHVEIFQYENIAEEERSIEVEEFKVNDLGRKPKRLSTSTSPISSRSSSLTWYEEDDDCTEGTFNYTTILNFIKSGKYFQSDSVIQCKFL